ncbi:MAG: hypothetical protein G01um10148_35 [Parcubacteria group bacterium Gr01-1014_8]|nr:MAG: hypothetical protein G01um10148_35 [Parcubacteria group bacterium Gr01-1014_8]
MNTFSIGDSIKFGWNTFTKRPWFFIGVIVCLFIVYGILSTVTDPEKSNIGGMQFLVSIAAGVIGIFVDMMLVNIALRSHDAAETVKFSDGWNKLPFWSYLGVKILNGTIVIVGLILLIVPGIIALLILMFSNYLVIDKGLGPIEAMKESARITKGHRLQLLLFILAIAGLNIVGALALFVGLLVTIPITILAMAHVYRTLEHRSSEVVPVTSNVAA